MKKAILSLSALLTMNFCYAQWTTSGSNIYYNSGNIGIGTTSPTATLHIQSSVTPLALVNSLLSSSNTAGETSLYFGDLSSGVSMLRGSKRSFNTRALEIWTEYGFNVASKAADFFHDYINFYTSDINRLTITNTGNVGIGTTNPANTLDITGTLGISSLITSTVGAGEIFRNLSGNTNPLTFRLKNAGNDFYVGTEGSVAGGYFAASLPYSTVIYSAMPIQSIVGGVAATIIQGNGNFGIGTTDTHGYKLAVNGSAIATTMTVKLYANWPDYVFNKTYALPKLSDVETYIDANHHLPGIPTKQQIAKDGLNLGEINELLVKKVEELTLYLIDKDKEIKHQQQVNRSAEARIKKLEKGMKFLLRKK
ncbi:MAG: hypothetical protein ACHQHN_11845 [Sphingobacteriales bacterium]